MDKQSGPMRENILKTLDADPPANKITWQRRKLPAGNFDPGRNGWLCQVPFGLDTWGLSKLLLQQLGCQAHLRQLVDYLLCSYDRNHANSRSKWVTHTICLGSVCMFVPCANIL